VKTRNGTSSRKELGLKTDRGICWLQCQCSQQGSQNKRTSPEDWSIRSAGRRDCAGIRRDLSAHVGDHEAEQQQDKNPTNAVRQAGPRISRRTRGAIEASASVHATSQHVAASVVRRTLIHVCSKQQKRSRKQQGAKHWLTCAGCFARAIEASRAVSAQSPASSIRAGGQRITAAIVVQALIDVC
jgi:hypothetical protein